MARMNCPIIWEYGRTDCILPTVGGQTALNTSMALHKNGALARHGVEMIGAKPEAIHKGEDRLVFKELMLAIGLDVPISGVAHNMDEARAIADKIGRFPLIIRPAFTLGGTVTLKRPFAKGFTVQGAYTYGKVITDAETAQAINAHVRQRIRAFKASQPKG